MRKNDAFVTKIVITRLTKAFMAMFAPAESLPSPATLFTPHKSQFWYTTASFRPVKVHQIVSKFARKKIAKIGHNFAYTISGAGGAD